MVLDALFAVVGGALIFFVPGYFLVKAAWVREAPSPEIGRASIPIFAFVLSMGLTIIVGSILGFLPHDGKRGYFQTWGSGVPFLEGALLLLSLAFFLIAAHRGAFPRLSERSRAKGGGFLAEGGIQRMVQALKAELAEKDRDPAPSAKPATDAASPVPESPPKP